MSRRWIMHVDMDAFYASVEQRDNPNLLNKPVIVGGLSLRGVVATASYEARRYGVSSAMSMKKAKTLCPQGIFVRPRMAVYRDVSAQIHAIFHQYTPFIEPLSLDEAFLDISGMEKLYSKPIDIGKAIKKDIFEKIGLHASVGIGPNKFIAKIASDLQKPNGLVLVSYGMEKKFLDPLPISRLWGVGKFMEKCLKESGFHTIGDIARLKDFHLLVSSCGNQASHIYELAQGIDKREVEYDRSVQSIGNEETYEKDIEDDTVIDREWRYFANHVAKRLRHSCLQGRTISIKVRFSDFQTITKQTTLAEPTAAEETLYLLAKVLYNKIKIKKPIRLLGLTVGKLQDLSYQESLFQDNMKKENLTKTIDALTEQFGKDVVMKGVLWERLIVRGRGENDD